jgi:hypothetical protein
MGQKLKIEEGQGFLIFVVVVLNEFKRFERILDQGNLNSTQDLNSEEGLNIFKEQKFNKEDFEELSEIKNQLGPGMKFEPRYFDCNKFPNLERLKPFLNRKFEILLEDSNSNQRL